MKDQLEKPFYVGYLPQAPSALSCWLRPRIFALFLLILLIAGGIVLQQKAFGPGVFEFQNYRNFEGLIIANPAPALLVDRPSGSQTEGSSLYYLVEFGKKGGQEAVAEFHGQRVRLRGALIYRDNQTMIELENGATSLVALSTGSNPPQGEALGQVTLVGEIVDSKCYFGVMKPGNLKTHKACAIRCISGGIPPVLLIRNAAGEARYVLLVDEAGGAVNQRILAWVAEPVQIKGMLETFENIMVLKANPDEYQHP